MYSRHTPHGQIKITENMQRLFDYVKSNGERFILEREELLKIYANNLLPSVLTQFKKNNILEISRSQFSVGTAKSIVITKFGKDKYYEYQDMLERQVIKKEKTSVPRVDRDRFLIKNDILAAKHIKRK